MDKIMIIEDTHLFRLQVRKALENNGFNDILEYGSADQIIQMPHMYLNDVSLIILDIELPGISGIDFANQLKSSTEYCNIPVIFISGNSNSKNVHAAIEAGGIDYIAKPFKLDVLVQRVEKVLDTYYGGAKGKNEYKMKKIMEIIINEYERATRAGTAISFLVYKMEKNIPGEPEMLVKRSIRKIDSVMTIEDKIIVALPLTKDKNANIVVVKLRDIMNKNNIKLHKVVSYEPSSGKSLESLKEELFG